MQELFNESIENNYPIFKDRSGRKIMLPEEDRINDGQVVRYINIRATILVKFNSNNASRNLCLFVTNLISLSLSVSKIYLSFMHYASPFKINITQKT